MINHLDNLLRHLFVTEISDIASASQVRFQAPDEDWRTAVGNLNALALNVYLVDLRENRKLRSNARVPAPAINGQMMRQPAPARVDCHYLISAWSPTQPGPAVEPTLDEQALLYQVIAVLMNKAPLNPSRIYPQGSMALNNTPEAIRDADLPLQILPVEGFLKLAEFWGTMGANYRWKPIIYLIVTLPVVLDAQIAGPMVTTAVTEYRQTGKPETAEYWVHIGGHVLDATIDPTQPLPVSNAWVRIEQVGGAPVQTTKTNDDGQFHFFDLQPGQYQLNWRASGFPIPIIPRVIVVPSPTGEYDLIFE